MTRGLVADTLGERFGPYLPSHRRILFYDSEYGGLGEFSVLRVTEQAVHLHMARQAGAPAYSD